MKDPAFMFYSSDFLTGCASLNFIERGQYITLLCLQHQIGHLSKKIIDLNINNLSDDVMNKFIKDKVGNFYNKRLEYEIKKREEHSKKQKANIMKRWNNKDKNVDTNSLPIEYEDNTKNIPLDNDNDNEDINIIINNSISDNNIKKLFYEFLDLRKLLKAKNTIRAIKLLLTELVKYDDDLKVKVIENSIKNSWKDLYPLKKNNSDILKNTNQMLQKNNAEDYWKKKIEGETNDSTRN